MSPANGTISNVDGQSPSADLLGDLLGPLAIEGPPSNTVQPQQNIDLGLEGDPNAFEATAIVPVGEQPNSVQVLLWLLHLTFSAHHNAFEDVGGTQRKY